MISKVCFYPNHPRILGDFSSFPCLLHAHLFAMLCYKAATLGATKSHPEVTLQLSHPPQPHETQLFPPAPVLSSHFFLSLNFSKTNSKPAQNTVPNSLSLQDLHSWTPAWDWDWDWP